ncbi:lytic transglycosylase domain-containing protein [Nitrosomonas communis]|uniref:lytic transglycosylase domain-containing protein n=1 Tax=Nitrosomonas communis TaxID=44574 RepID=UPI0026EF6867|nr:transglycosylase SLT domain-containing protein [Nitrosomonas communis]MCO6429033.1 transglycosylase SLT domain-containing protein [Nitrosomonas communis]
MDKAANLSNSSPANIKPKPRRTRGPITRTDPSKSGKRSKKYQPGSFRRKLLLVSIEIISLGLTAVLAIMVLLGYAANQFSGTSFFSSLLPFAIGVLALILVVAVFFIGWWKLRKWLQLHSELLTPLLSFSFALLITWFVIHGQFTLAYGNFRTLVGGKEEAGRMTIAHQVYAAYRRYNPSQLQKMINRSQEYRQAIKDAANAFDVDVNLLQGIAATESSFMPRDSSDGGRGLFQITQVPRTVVAQALKRLNAEKISLENPWHNAFIAAATFKHYLAEMKGDLFLALLAYNIGPANGGLRFIMQQYGASDFTTIQPYLQTLPRDYPIRVLSYSLAFRLWQKEGKLLAYEEGNNAIHIQRIGIPGLHAGL